jgi:excisionase family DNA binding protein
MKLFTTGKLAMLLKVHPSKIYRMMRRGELPSYRPEGWNYWLIPLTDEEVKELVERFKARMEDVGKYAMSDEEFRRKEEEKIGKKG